MAEREFIGEEWFNDLIQQEISFYIRIRNYMMVKKPDHESKKASWLFNDLKCGTYRHYEKLYYLGNNLVSFLDVKLLML